MSKIGVVLSGGGSRCISQLGFLKYLEELDVEISAISGASGGAIAAGLYATGLSADEVFFYLKEIDFKAHLKLNITKGTLYSFEKEIDHFHKIFGKVDINESKILFFCAITDYESGKIVYKSEGDLVTMMLSSCALVPIFAPIKVDGKVYADGGICDNLPALPLMDVCDKIIAINVNPISSHIRYSFKGHFQRAMFLMLNANVEVSKKMCDLFVEIEQMGYYSIFDLKNFDLFYEIGYNEAKKYKNEIERLL